MLINRCLIRTFKASRQLKVYDVNGTNSMSGITATVFGATGFIGNNVVSRLGAISSDIVCPSREKKWYSDKIKDLRYACSVGYVYVNHHTNYNDPNTIRRLVEKSNVVVNCLGPRARYIRPERFREVNVEYPWRIARQARKAGVNRLIHFSSVGVDPQSESQDLATKWEGEQRVLEEFPDSTIFRCTTVTGLNDYFTRLFRIQSSWFDRFVPVYSDLSAKRQPILAGDVADCVLSAIKLNSSRGQIFELGGPHVYTIKELYDFMSHSMRRPVTYAKLPRDFALTVGNFLAYDHFNAERIKKDTIDLIVNPSGNVKTIADLYFQPASVIPTIEFEVGRWQEQPLPVKNEREN